MYKIPNVYSLWPSTKFHLSDFILRKSIRCADCIHRRAHGNAQNNGTRRQVVVDETMFGNTYSSLCPFLWIQLYSCPWLQAGPYDLLRHWNIGEQDATQGWKSICTFLLSSPWEEHTTLGAIKLRRYQEGMRTRGNCAELPHPPHCESVPPLPCCKLLSKKLSACLCMTLRFCGCLLYSIIMTTVDWYITKMSKSKEFNKPWYLQLSVKQLWSTYILTWAISKIHFLKSKL